MKKSTILLLCILFIFTGITQAQIFVDHNAAGNNDGTSWNDAFTDLQDALAVAIADNDIWIAAGIYTPVVPNDQENITEEERDISFQIRSGVSLYGGYNGTEDPDLFNLEDRLFDANETVLSGNISDNENSNSNSYTVLSAIELSDRVIIDGITITGGNSNGTSGMVQSGGGLYVLNSAEHLELRNLSVKQNSADEFGGGIYISASDFICENCMISENQAKRHGAGIWFNSPNRLFEMNHSEITGNIINENFNNSRGGGAHILGANKTVTLFDLTIKQNSGGHQGGGMYIGHSVTSTMEQVIFEENNVTMDGPGNRHGGGLYFFAPPGSSLTILNSEFINNATNHSGGGAYLVGASGIPDILLQNVLFEGNTSITGGSGGNGLYVASSNITIQNSIITNNTRSGIGGQGGGIYQAGGNLFRITDTKISGNTIGNDGGGIRSSSAYIEWENVIIEENESNNRAGSYIGDSRGGYLNNVSFLNNTAAVGTSGGLDISGSATYQMDIRNSLFSGNSANPSNQSGIGGGILHTASIRLNIINSIITNNTAFDGGGIYISQQNVSVNMVNSVIAHNSATRQGGGLLYRNTGSEIVNTIFYKNSAETGNHVYQSFASNENLFAYNIFGGTPGSYIGIDGGNNMEDTDPEFADSTGLNYRLLESSPAISAGNTDVIFNYSFFQNQDGDPLDLDLNPRARGAAIDIGAYENPVGDVIVSFSDDKHEEIPATFALNQNYPNPFNPSTVISYQLPVTSEVRLLVFDMIGRRVAILVNGQVTAGTHHVTFDSHNLASGLFLYRLEAGSNILTRKMLLVK